MKIASEVIQDVRNGLGTMLIDEYGWEDVEAISNSQALSREGIIEKIKAFDGDLYAVIKDYAQIWNSQDLEESINKLGTIYSDNPLLKEYRKIIGNKGPRRFKESLKNFK